MRWRLVLDVTGSETRATTYHISTTYAGDALVRHTPDSPLVFEPADPEGHLVGVPLPAIHTIPRRIDALTDATVGETCLLGDRVVRVLENGATWTICYARHWGEELSYFHELEQKDMAQYYADRLNSLKLQVPDTKIQPLNPLSDSGHDAVVVRGGKIYRCVENVTLEELQKIPVTDITVWQLMAPTSRLDFSPSTPLPNNVTLDDTRYTQSEDGVFRPTEAE